MKKVPASAPGFKLADIAVNGRHRKDLGDLGALAASIERHGLIQPIVLDPASRLLAGHRRMQAVKLLGWTEIPAVVLETNDPLGVENDENSCRKNFTPSEAVAIARAMEDQETEAAKERQRDHGGTAPGKPNTPGNFPGVTGRARDVIAARVGMSGRTLEKALAVVEAAERHPEAYAPLVTQMDRTGKIDRVHKELLHAQKRKHFRNLAATAKPDPEPSVEVWTGDFREEGRRIADESVDLVLTDPPYIEAALPLWDPLGAFAARVLKPGGLLVAYTGHYWFPRCSEAIEKHLRWLWLAVVRLSGPSTEIHALRFQPAFRPVLMFVKGEYKARWFFRDMLEDDAMEKGLHEWQQGTPAFRTFIEKFTDQGGLVVDPFAGSGTTLVAAAETGRRAIGIEIDPKHADVARGRVAEALEGKGAAQ
jgi:SAM-dependent methyltransferase